MIVIEAETAMATVLKKNDAANDPIMANPLISLYLRSEYRNYHKVNMSLLHMISSCFWFLTLLSFFVSFF